MRRPRAMVIGHSIVRRLDEWMWESGETMEFRDLAVRLHGVGGSNIRGCCSDLSQVSSFIPGTIYLQIGGNDLTLTSTPQEIVRMMDNLVGQLLGFHHVNRVIIGSILFREKPRGMSMTKYDRRKKKVNKILAAKYGNFHPSKTVSVFTHRSCRDEYFMDDGVHLNDWGNVWLFQSIRSSLRMVLSSL